MKKTMYFVLVAIFIVIFTCIGKSPLASYEATTGESGSSIMAATVIATLLSYAPIFVSARIKGWVSIGIVMFFISVLIAGCFGSAALVITVGAAILFTVIILSDSELLRFLMKIF